LADAMVAYEKRIQVSLDEFERRIEAMEKGDGASASTASGGHASKRPRPAGSAASRASSAPPWTDLAGAVTGRVWANGFGRELLAKQLRSFGEEILKKNVPTALAARVKIRAFNLSANLSIDFPDAASASDFLAKLRVEEIRWQDPRDGTRKEIRFRPDRTIGERMTTGALSVMYTPVKDLIMHKGKWTADMRMGTTGPKGSLFVITEADITKLFMVKTWMAAGETHQEITFDSQGIRSFGITEEEANGIIDSARASIAERARHS